MPRRTAPVGSSWATPDGRTAGRAALPWALPTTCPPSPWKTLRVFHRRLDNPRPPGAQRSRTSCGRGLPTLPTAPTTTGFRVFRRKACFGDLPTRRPSRATSACVEQARRDGEPALLVDPRRRARADTARAHLRAG